MITTPIQRIYKPDVSRLISALERIDVNASDATESFAKIAECVVGCEAAVSAPYVTDKKDFIVTTNEELYNALCEATEGQVIFVPGETVIDMADYIMLYRNNVQSLPILKKGVTLMGERGVDGCRGGIIRAICVAHPLLAAEEGSFITGLAIGGHDGFIEEKALTEHQSVGIRIDGDNVKISNCEIAGFARCAVQANGYQNIRVENCYIHDIYGTDSGVAIEGAGASVALTDNTFLRVRAIGSEGVEVAETGSSYIEYPALTNPADFHLPVVCADASNNDEGYMLIRKLLLSECITKNDIHTVVDLVGEFTNYMKYAHSFDLDGEHFGPRAEFAPIGGGKGYKDIFTDGDFVVKNGEEFLSALDACKDGDVIFIPGDCVIDISDSAVNPSDKYRFSINKSITIASNRGQILSDGSVSHGGVLYWPNFRPYHYCFVNASDVRITGLIFKGPDFDYHLGHHTRSFYNVDENGNLIVKPKEERYYYALHMGSGFTFNKERCEVDNCESCGITVGALNFHMEMPPEDQPDRKRSEGHSVHHCYIHHNGLGGLGYGVTVAKASVDIYSNLFNYNRHSIASCGIPEAEYFSHDNIEMGEAIGHHFDVHGGEDRGDGTTIAGDRCELEYNTVLSRHKPYYLRGRTVRYQTFHHNACFMAPVDYKPNMTLRHGERYDNLYIGKNLWDIAKTPFVQEDANWEE